MKEREKRQRRNKVKKERKKFLCPTPLMGHALVVTYW
jgi:hypothetical protein